MQISYFNIFVSNLESAISFYRDKLKLSLESASLDHGYASFSGGTVRLGIAVLGEDHANLIGRHTGIGFRMRDLDSEFARLSALGVHFTMPPMGQPWGGVMAMISDPDPNNFYLDQLLPTESQLHD